MTYQLNLSVFEGPFDLLLHLVKVNEMDCADINVSQITDEYLKTIQLMQDLDLEVAGDFLVMAATLVNLKARALLPEQPAEEPEGETEDIADIMSAKQLMSQLIEYRKFKELSAELSVRQEDQMRLFYRNGLLAALDTAQGAPALRADLSLLFDCFSRVLRFVESRPRHDVAFEPFSVEQRIGALRERLRAGETLELFALFRAARSKADMIVSFLALLELSRLKFVRLEQGRMYGEVFAYPRDPEEIAEAPRPEAVTGELPDAPVEEAPGKTAVSPGPFPVLVEEDAEEELRRPAEATGEDVRFEDDGNPEYGLGEGLAAEDQEDETGFADLSITEDSGADARVPSAPDTIPALAPEAVETPPVDALAAKENPPKDPLRHGQEEQETQPGY